MKKEHIFKSTSFKELINHAIAFLEGTPVESLPPSTRFSGSGVYVLYYFGNCKVYEGIYGEPHLPIYVGKAVPPGWRQARMRSDENDGSLFRRLSEHARNIASTDNLSLSDFRCRFILFAYDESDLVGTVEAALIRKYNPLWNSFIDGFGNHDPGSGRYDQAKSEWDVLHPGREWANRLRGVSPKSENILKKIKNYKR